MKNRYNPSLQGLTQVNHHVAAAEQIHAGEGRVVEDVLRGKNAQIADSLANLVAAIGFVKKTAQPYRRHVRLDVFLVYRSPGALDRVLAQVGAKDLDRNVGSLFSQVLHERDCVGVSLFAGRTSRNPDADGRHGGG